MDLGQSKIILFCLGLILGAPDLKAQDFTPAPPPEAPELTSLLDHSQIEDLVWREINQIFTQFKVSPRPFLWVQVIKWPLAAKTPTSWDITFKINGEGSLLLEKEARKRIARTMVAKGFRFQLAPAFGPLQRDSPRDQDPRPLVVIKTPLNESESLEILPAFNLALVARSCSWCQALIKGSAWSERTQFLVLISLGLLALMILGFGVRTQTAKKIRPNPKTCDLLRLPELPELASNPTLIPLQEYYLLSQLRRSCGDGSIKTKISFCSKSLGSDLRPRVRNHPVSKIDR